MKVIHEVTSKVIRYATYKEYYQHQKEMMNEGFEIVKDKCLEGVYTVFYKKKITF